MDEAPSGAAVPIAERVDGLELGVSYRGLGDGGQVIEVHERCEIVEQVAYPVLGRGDERGVGGTQPASADPVLIAANDTRVSGLGRPFKERVVDGEEIVDAESLPASTKVYRLFHGTHVAEHGSGGTVPGERLVGGEG